MATLPLALDVISFEWRKWPKRHYEYSLDISIYLIGIKKAMDPRPRPSGVDRRYIVSLWACSKEWILKFWVTLSPLVISWIIQTDREENDRKHNSHGWIVVLYGGAAVCAAIPEQEN